MKIELKKLRIENFMIYGSAEFDFSDRTNISAKNGKGKSSIANAYMWLLFNCDTELHDNPPIRRVINGKSVDDMDVAVTAVLDIDGVETIVKKVQKRTYQKDGISYKDDNKYFINEVPKTLKAYNEYFNIDMEVFKMCSNINAFISQKSSEMREFLFGAVNDITDKEIAKANANLKELLPLLEKYSTEELLAMNKATKAKATNDLPFVDGQINEKERDIVIKRDIDLAEWELLKKDLQKQLQENIEQQNSAEKVVEEYQKISDKIVGLKTKIAELQNKANEDLRKQGADIKVQIQMNYDLLEKIMLDEKTGEQKINQCKSFIESTTNEKITLADNWRTVNNEVFDENSIICPTCKQELPVEQIEHLKATFQQSKVDRLNKIEKIGMEKKNYISKMQATLDKLEQEKQDNLLKKAEIDKLIENLKADLSKIPNNIDISDTTEYQTIQAEIVANQEQLKKFDNNSELRATLKNTERELQQRLTECESKFTMADTTADEKRLAELKEQRLDLEQSKANAEKILSLLDDLDKAKNDALTDSINSNFGLVKWQLFELAKNGNYKNCCIPMVDGKSILNTMSNKGNRILGKADICNSIQKISGVICPIWIDDCENLDIDNQSKIAGMINSQLIMLVVNNNDKIEVVGY